MTTIKIHNAETGEIIEREMNAEELADLKTRQAETQARKLAEAELKANQEAAQIKLVALGLTPNDLRALGL